MAASRSCPTAAAWALGVPLAFTIALITLTTSYIPHLGAIFAGAFATLIALGSNGIQTAVVLLVVVLGATLATPAVAAGVLVHRRLVAGPAAAAHGDQA
jgi:predicted PurR-regulated permease PerM